MGVRENVGVGVRVDVDVGVGVRVLVGVCVGVLKTEHPSAYLIIRTSLLDAPYAPPVATIRFDESIKRQFMSSCCEGLWSYVIIAFCPKE